MGDFNADGIADLVIGQAVLLREAELMREPAMWCLVAIASAVMARLSYPT